jgi:hypothetical protein
MSRDADRQWLLEQLANETEMFARNEGNTGDFYRARGNLVLDIAEHFKLISGEEKDFLYRSLVSKDAAAIREAAQGPKR